ncbi:MAG: tagatose 1,6-diphosphate aldolase [Anaerolineales bacterium]|nr:tagatose 1,6-diphosphate aldolase [Anaerolineales bacterium]
MKSLSIGKFRGLQQCTSDRGTFTCLALDHRQNLRKALNPQNPSLTTDAELSQFKLDVTSLLAPYATAVLLDPEVSAAQAIAARALSGHTAFVVAVESTGYGGAVTARQSQILPGWSVEKAKRMGAGMIKLLVYYHPESATAAEIEDFTRQVGEECIRYDLGLMLEPLSYSLQAGASLSSEEKRSVVVETARRLTRIPGIDILKAEFPQAIDDLDPANWEAACAELTAASAVPWILLSAAVSFDIYQQQIITACRAGASGIAVGRAVWQEAVTLRGEERLNFLRTIGRERLTRLNALCTALARSIREFYGAEAPFDWYRNY